MDMDKKQKSLLVLTLIALFFLVYEVVQLVHGDLPSDPSPAPVTLAIPQTTPVIKTPVAQNTADPGLAKNQQEYLNMLNQYELAKLKRQLLQEQAAIATAQNQIAELHQKSQQMNGPDNSTEADVPEMVLSYLGQEGNEWSATVNVNGNYQTVSVGSQLQNGFTVVRVSQQGVLLSKDQEQTLLTFNGLLKLPTNTALSASPPTPAAPTATTVTTPTLAVVPAALPLPKVQKKTPAPIIAKGDGATESADTLYTQEDTLPLGLHLDPVDIHPVVTEPFQASTYLPKPEVVPVSDTNESLVDQSVFSKETSEEIPHKKSHPIIKVAPSIWHLPPTHFVLQLMASPHYRVATAFIKRHHLSGRAMLVHTLKQGKVWYIVLYGDYNTSAIAKAAARKLPKSLHHYQIVICQVSDVQRVLNHLSN